MSRHREIRTLERKSGGKKKKKNGRKLVHEEYSRTSENVPRLLMRLTRLGVLEEGSRGGQRVS